MDYFSTNHIGIPTGTNLELQCHFGKERHTFDFYKFIFTLNVYLLDLDDLAFFLYFVFES